MSENFAKPLYLRNGSYIQEIIGLDDALDFLEEWPEDRRTLPFELATEACLDAYVGKIPVGSALDNLERFAKGAKVLACVEELLPLKPKAGGRKYT